MIEGIDWYSLVAVDECYIVVGVESGVPRRDQVETVACAGETRCIEFELALVDHVRTVLLDDLSDEASLVEPLFDIVRFVPPAGSNRTLSARLVQVGLVTELPISELAVAQRFADQRHGADQSVVSHGAVLGQVEPVEVGHAGPGRVGVKVRWTNGYCGGIV